MAHPIVGVWKLVSPERDGLIIYTDKHYSILLSHTGRERREGDEPTLEEIKADYDAVQAMTGTYSVSGSTVTYKRDANLRGSDLGMVLVHEVSIDGDNMTVRVVGGKGPEGAEARLRRVE